VVVVVCCVMCCVVELMKSLGGEDLLGGLGGSEGSTGGAKVRDQLLEQFLQVTSTYTNTYQTHSTPVSVFTSQYGSSLGG
jgi:preprotein translocase subunit SecG